MDGVDAAIVRLTSDRLKLEHYAEFPYPAALRRRLEAVVLGETARLSELGSLHVEVALAFAGAAQALLARAGLDARAVIAIGSHGQTLLHRPGNSPPFSLQIGDPSAIAWRTGITTVADFRAMDLAAGGQGAPLVPAFHRFAFGSDVEARAVLNIGGIANLSLLRTDGAVQGFDTGPGNTLMDGWAKRHLDKPCDEDGAWARSGRLLPAVLGRALEHPYFSQPPPKSTGRDVFSVGWVAELMRASAAADAQPEDVQCTLTELTALSVARALRGSMPECTQLAVCGGGIRNRFLMERLTLHLDPLQPKSTDVWGLPPESIEACAFAWLAAARVSGVAGNVPGVTGARQPVCLGGLYVPDIGLPAWRSTSG